MFLVGDAPPHMDYAQDMKYPEVMRIARSQQYTVNAVQAGNARDTERYWREIAQMGQGEYIPIPQDGGAVVMIKSPYDREIIELQGRINHTVIPYGPQQQRERVINRSEQHRAAPAPVASEMAGYMAKSRAGQANADAITGGGDLLADVKAGRQSLGGVKDQDLPDNMRGMSARERQTYLDQQTAQRSTLNDRMADLVKKRDAYVADQRKKQPNRGNSFDRAVEDVALTDQVSGQSSGDLSVAPPFSAARRSLRMMACRLGGGRAASPPLLPFAKRMAGRGRGWGVARSVQANSGIAWPPHLTPLRRASRGWEGKRRDP